MLISKYTHTVSLGFLNTLILKFQSFKYEISWFLEYYSWIAVLKTGLSVNQNTDTPIQLVCFQNLLMGKCEINSGNNASRTMPCALQ